MRNIARLALTIVSCVYGNFNKESRNLETAVNHDSAILLIEFPRLRSSVIAGRVINSNF